MGVHVDEFASAPDRIPGKTIKVRYNRAKNIDGRTARDPQTGRVFLQAQFVQLAGVRDLSGVEIAWNEIINEPNNSRVEDNISMFYSSGTSASPIRIYHNYIQGSYPIPATEQNYSGGGIMVSETGDIKDLNENTVGAFVEVYENQVVGTNHYGIAFTGGHDLKVYNNKIISSSVFEPALPTGPVPLSANVGIFAYNHDAAAGSAPTSLYYNNQVYNNTIGYINRNNSSVAGTNLPL
jgi:hypothetical protein